MYRTCLDPWTMFVYSTLPHLEPLLVDCIFFKHFWGCIAEGIYEVDKLDCLLLKLRFLILNNALLLCQVFLTLWTLLL